MCEDCGGIEDSCTHGYIQFGEEIFERRKTTGEGGRCHDCAIDQTKTGNIHHQNCDWERCPRCSRQLLSCGCSWDHCDETCGNWEDEGCEKDHSGRTWKKPPKGAITIYNEERKKAVMAKHAKRLTEACDAYEMKMLKDLKKSRV